MELLSKGDVVDTIRIGRYDVPAFRRIMKELGLKRDETYTWERRKAEYQMEQAFRQSYLKGDTQEEVEDAQERKQEL